jgi:hypothetical protein
MMSGRPFQQGSLQRSTSHQRGQGDDGSTPTRKRSEHHAPFQRSSQPTATTPGSGRGLRAMAEAIQRNKRRARHHQEPMAQEENTIEPAVTQTEEVSQECSTEPQRDGNTEATSQHAGTYSFNRSGSNEPRVNRERREPSTGLGMYTKPKPCRYCIVSVSIILGCC